MMRILVTRPRSEAEQTAAGLRALGHVGVIAPVLSIEAIADVAIPAGPFGAVLMTSGNAARAIAAHRRIDALAALDCFAVGEPTAAAARQAGFARVYAAGGDGGDLARLIGERLAVRDKPLLYLAGNDRARDMAAELAPYGVRIEIVVVYRARAATALPADVVQGLRAGAFDAAMHYSRRSTATFVDCVVRAGVTDAATRLTHYCLSERAAEPLAAINTKSILVAQNRDESAMLALISTS